MIYQYVLLTVVWLIAFYLYKVYSSEVPKIIKKHIYLLQFVALLAVIIFIGTPVKFKSTTFSGKHSFQSIPVVVDKVEADPNPAADLEKQTKLLKQNTKEIQNEID
jgi:hypothetical protein